MILSSQQPHTLAYSNQTAPSPAHGGRMGSYHDHGYRINNMVVSHTSDVNMYYSI